MRRFYLVAFFLLVSVQLSWSQVGVNSLNVGFDAGITLNEFFQNEFPAGFGGSVKALYGVGMNGQVSLTGGFTYFPIKSTIALPAGDNVAFNLMPLTIGYRMFFDQLFFEPQVGGALHVTRNRFAQNSDNVTTAELGFAAEAGYVFDPFELSFRYQHTGRSPFHMGFLAVRVMYRIPVF
ncbi:hypothetical protein ADIS_0447 [Lunatimonas lonarensis]|uniref:Outer membrane protein beta-barrel domain-containing protein n=1 Tax=Lunatimonas lonarensis TaxID=1232681 RepID=R7ZY04_9BACT|nr:hypothetical protein [Lunatimonas lonarensis]EON79030.1 hypothetical protein ADIS_0447 [Lunatimonas lonarensis]